MRCLVLTGELPYPTDSGLRVYAAGCAEALASAGAEVVGLSLGDGRPYAGPGGIEWRTVDAKPASRWRTVASRLPAMAAALDVAPMRAALESALRGQPWDAAVIHHLQAGWAVDLLVEARARGQVGSIVHMSHNHEATVRRDVVRQHRGNPVKTAALWWDARKVASLERRVVEASDLLTSIGDDDATRFAADAPTARLLTVPPGYSGEPLSSRHIDESVPRRVVIVSNLEWHVKRMNLVRFLEAADALFTDAGAEIVVVGPVPDDFAASLRSWTRATTFTGGVSSVDGELAGARVGLIAEPAGGGFKLKSLDYVFRRVPVAVLAGSMAGMPLRAGESMLEFADDRELALGALAVLDDLPRLEALQETAYEACAAAFDWKQRGVALHAAIAEMMST
jgi:polysaccharide biosynthesis protein PslH